MKISVLQHAACEGPGEIAKWAVARGHSVAIVHLYRGDPLPGMKDFDALVVMGGEMNIYQYRDHPWLMPERQLIAAVMEAGRRVVGICLGSQLIADALGSRVTQNPVHEIGWFPVQFTPEAHERHRKLPASATVLHWHGDTFELPRGATRLAASEACAEQGFVIERKCLGLQFHLEMDSSLVRDTVQGSSPYEQWPKGPWVQSPDMILKHAATYSVENRELLYGLLDAFFAE